jgi:hypothetical protein
MTHPLTPADVVRRVWAPWLQFVARNWRTVAAAGAIGAVLGVAIHFLRTREYRALGVYVLVTAQPSASQMSSLGLLASQFGLGDVIPGTGFDLATLAKLGRSDRTFSHVIASIDGLAVADSGLRRDWYRIALDPQRRTPARVERLIRRLGSMLDISVDTRSRTVDIAASAPSRALAHQMAMVYVATLDTLTSDLQSGQVRILRLEAERQATEAHDSLRAAEAQLQQFLSRNRAFNDPVLEFRARQLERDATLRSTLYQQVASRLAEARLEEKRSSPALMAISPPRLPVRPVGPGGLTLVILGAFFGSAGAAVFLVWGKESQAG